MIIFFINYNNILASETYYSEYSDYNNYQLEEIIETDSIDVESSYFFTCYNLNKIKGDYYIYGENSSLFPYIDEFDYIKTEFSEWNDNSPKLQPNRIIENREVYYYQDIDNIRYIHLDKFLGGNNKLNINEIKVFSDENLIDYEVYCDGCNIEFNDYINNGNIYQENSYIDINGYLRLDLLDYYDLKNLKIELYFTDYTNEEKRYEINTSKDQNFSSNMFTYVLERMFFKHNSNTEVVKKEWKLADILFKNPTFQDKVLSLDYIESSKTRKVFKANQYRYFDTLYQYYNLEKKYSKQLLQNPSLEFPYCDEGNIYYRSRYRDKIVLKKDIIITDYNQKLEDFIIETTNSDILIKSDIDYYHNGNYYVEYILPYITINKNIVVNINNNKNSYLESSTTTKEDLVNKSFIEKIEYQSINDDDTNNLVVFKTLEKPNSLNSILNNSSDDFKKKRIFCLLLLFITIVLLVIIALFKKGRNKTSSSFVETV